MTKRKQRTQYGVDNVRKKIKGIEQLILKGSVLAIDPSIISSSSFPGYAWYVGGELDSAGIIEGISHRESVEKRLQFIGKYVRENFEEPDVLIYERVAARGGGFSLESTVKATGAIIGNFECEYVIPIAPLAWGTYVNQKLDIGKGNDYENYQVYKEKYKSDEMDAIMIGYSLIQIAKENR